MNKNRPIITYEPEADVLTYELSGQPIDYAKEIGNVVVHFNKNSLPVLVEILEATKFLKEAGKVAEKTRGLSLANPC